MKPEGVALKRNVHAQAGASSDLPSNYRHYVRNKVAVISLFALLTVILGIYAINAGSAKLSPLEVLMTLFGKEGIQSQIIIWNIRLPRIIAAIVAGIGLSVAGCVMQNLLRNPLASPFTLGISQGAAFGAAIAITLMGAGTTQSTSSDAVIINNPYLVTISAFICSMAATMVVLALAKCRGGSPESMILAGVALGSLFSAGTTIIQYFAQDTQVASIVFWTFGDLGRATWTEVKLMTLVIGIFVAYFMWHRWNYNAIESGEETAKGLGVDVEKLRLKGMFFASLMTSVAVSFLGIIGFIGLVGPHMVKRLIGGDHRFLIPGSCVMGGLLLLAADTLARTIIAPVVLPVGAVTSFLGAPLFLYLLFRGYQKR